MKILFLCNKSPFPPKEGGPIAMNSIIEGLLKAGHQVKVLALNTNKYFIDENEISEGYKKNTDIELIFKDLSVRPFEAFINLFSKKSYHVNRFISKDFKEKITEILTKENFDVVQLEMLYMTPYLDTIRNISNAKIILRSHNIEHLIWARIASATENPVKKLYLNYLTQKLKKYELKSLNHYDGIATISKNDGDYFKDKGCTIPLTDIPFGLDISKFKSKISDYEFPSLFHLGSMNWMPNEEGLKWFLDNAWRPIHERLPNLKFYIAGRMMPEWLQNIDMPNIEVVGEVPDADQFINSKAVMVVPLFSGSGIRIKIIEGMAQGKTIISTRVGAEGIDYEDGKNILIANTPEEFLNVVDKCSESIEFCDFIGSNARKLIEEKHNQKVITQKLENFYKTVLEN